jgi:transposase
VGSKLDDVERQLILATLEEQRGDKKTTARILGIGLKTLYNRLGVYRAGGIKVSTDNAGEGPRGGRPPAAEIPEASDLPDMPDEPEIPDTPEVPDTPETLDTPQE